MRLSFFLKKGGGVWIGQNKGTNWGGGDGLRGPYPKLKAVCFEVNLRLLDLPQVLNVFSVFCVLVCVCVCVCVYMLLVFDGKEG